MHFAYPPRKSSNPPPFQPRSSKLPHLRRSRVKTISIIGLAIIGALWLISRLFSGSNSSQRQPSGHPPVVLVTVLDPSAYGKAHSDSVRENRAQYAARHGYESMIVQVGDYDVEGSPLSWTKVVALRHAMVKFPDCRYMWYLDQDSFIMDPTVTLEQHIMNPDRLEKTMLRDLPVVPPDSIIKTFAHLKGRDVDFVLSQDKEGLSIGSFVVRNGDWAQFLLETWYDPLYRGYNFQKAEGHALEHIVQWHPTILSKMAIVPQGLMSPYTSLEKGEQVYQPGDFVVRAAGCSKNGEGEKTCEQELVKYRGEWQKAFNGA